MKQDKLIIGGHEFDSRFILGSGKYSLDLINAAVQNAGAQIITLALRRTNTNDTANILDYIPEGVTLLPNTSGARNAEEAVRIARLSRAMGCGDFVKIEIMRDAKYLFPDVKKASAPYVQWLGQKENPEGAGWATGENYGYDIAGMLQHLLLKEQG